MIFQMDLKQLEYFVRVADSGGFSAAGSGLQLTQSALSRQIKLLETELGHRLFTRTGRGIQITQAGEVLMKHARAMLDAARLAKNELQDLQADPSGRLVIGMPPRVAMWVSPILVREFRAQFPKAVMSISEGLSIHLREWLIAGKLDVALLYDPPATPQLSYHTLLQESLVLVLPAKWPSVPEQVSLNSLPNFPMILPSEPNAIRSLVDSKLAPRQIKLNLVAEVSAVQTVLALVSEGVGCALLPQSALNLAGKSMAIQFRHVGPPTIRNRLVLAVAKAGPNTQLVSGGIELIKGLKFGQFA
jgi:LysR family nitrogen assimilation transcriptional regulator